MMNGKNPLHLWQHGNLTLTKRSRSTPKKKSEYWKRRWIACDCPKAPTSCRSTRLLVSPNDAHYSPWQNEWSDCVVRGELAKTPETNAVVITATKRSNLRHISKTTRAGILVVTLPFLSDTRGCTPGPNGKSCEYRRNVADRSSLICRFFMQ